MSKCHLNQAMSSETVQKFVVLWFRSGLDKGQFSALIKARNVGFQPEFASLRLSVDSC